MPPKPLPTLCEPNDRIECIATARDLLTLLLNGTIQAVRDKDGLLYYGLTHGDQLPSWAGAPVSRQAAIIELSAWLN